MFVSREIPEPGLSIVQRKLDAFVHRGKEPPSKKELFEKTKKVEGILVLITDQLDKDFFENAGRLKVVSSMSVGVDHIDLNAATKRGVVVTNTPDVLTEATADFTFALILSAARRIAEGDRYVRAGKWKGKWSPTLLLGHDVSDAALGIIGLGRIGQAVARRANGFGMKILYHDRTNSNARIAKTFDAKRVSLQRLLRESDIITLHVPLTPETRGMIGASEIAMMKKTAVFVNASRGGIVDQQALYDALSRRRIFGAGLDVFQEEPLRPDDPLLKLENVLITPHLGSASVQSRSKMSELAARNLVEALAGKMPRAIVNREVLKKRSIHR